MSICRHELRTDDHAYEGWKEREKAQQMLFVGVNTCMFDSGFADTECDFISNRVVFIRVISKNIFRRYLSVLQGVRRFVFVHIFSKIY